MVLQRADTDDKDRGIGSASALAAHQVDELLGAQVGPEAALRDDDIPEAETEAVREDRVVAVRDVRERPAVDEGRRTLEGLHQVRHEGVLQEDRRGAVHVQISDLHGPLLAVERDDDALEALLEVRDPFREAEDRHHLTRRRNHELVLPRDPVLRSAEARDDVAQLAVVHVEAPREQDPRGIDVQLVPVEDVRVQDRGDQIVRGADRVDVAREVQVDLLHREDLGSASARRPALRAEHGPEGGLTDRDEALRPEAIQGLPESDRGEGLPLSLSGRGGAGDEAELPLAGLPGPVDGGEADFRDGFTLQNEVVLAESDVRGDIEDSPHRGRLSDLDVRDHYRGKRKEAKRIFFVRMRPVTSRATSLG